MHWLANHQQIHHPWPNESHFLMAGAAEFPTSPIHPKGTTILAPRADLDGVGDFPWVMDKSTFHLYSDRALQAVKEHLPDAKVVITLRHPVDLMLSMHQEHNKRLMDYNTPLNEMLEICRSQSFEADVNAPETYSFLRFPRMKEDTIRWTEALGGRVRIVPLSSIATNPLATMNEILTWLEIDTLPDDTPLPKHNERGKLNQSGWARFLRQPPNLLVSLTKILLPTKGLRRAVLDPIRSPGFKPVRAESAQITEEVRAELETAFTEEIEFQENLTKYIDSSLIISP
tara:strand:- start:47 stop:904 length:858 start_codon:yes stop_codon:yes gene_type:complete